MSRAIVVLSLIIGLSLPGGAIAQSPPERAAPGRAAAPAEQPATLPPEARADHVLNLPGRTLRFSSATGAIRLANAETGAPRADIAYVAYRLSDADKATRPVAFVFNGGPGYASAWLQLGALGPWRLPMADEASRRPSAPPTLVDNADTWLDFADLVFIDPPGTGFSRVLGGEEGRKALWSVNGDVAVMAEAIRRWSEANDRVASPKFLVGESYGGFRAPKIARALQTDQGLGVAGMALISPALDFQVLRQPGSILGLAGALPSFAAARLERDLDGKRALNRDDLREVEAYASGPFILDLIKGPNDAAAVARIATRVAAFTGLDPALVARLGGRVTPDLFAREFQRDAGLVSSVYDANVGGYNPTPFATRGLPDDQMRVGFHAPMTEAMMDVYRNRLHWVVEGGRYQFFNERAAEQWDYGRRPPEAVSDLREALALDPGLRVLVAHGFTDLATQYFSTKLTLDQMPRVGPETGPDKSRDRVLFRVYPGGHMIYARDATRAAFRADARELFGGR